MNREAIGRLCGTNAWFHGDLLRNIKGIRRSQHLFDDLSEDSADWGVAIAAEGEGRITAAEALVDRAFDYGTAIAYSFDPGNWQATRFSDGRRYGVWYGAPELETTVYETVFHWHRFLLDSFADADREIRGERRVFAVRCEALLVDLRGRVRSVPELIDRTSYRLTQALGDFLVAQGQNGLLSRSARHTGDVAALFRRERLSEVRHRTYLTYRCNPMQDRVVVERTPGRTLLEIAPSSLA